MLVPQGGVTETTLVVGSLAASSLERVKVYRLVRNRKRLAGLDVNQREQIRIDGPQSIMCTELELAEICSYEAAATPSCAGGLGSGDDVCPVIWGSNGAACPVFRRRCSRPGAEMDSPGI